MHLGKEQLLAALKLARIWVMQGVSSVRRSCPRFNLISKLLYFPSADHQLHRGEVANGGYARQREDSPGQNV